MKKNIINTYAYLDKFDRKKIILYITKKYML